MTVAEVDGGFEEESRGQVGVSGDSMCPDSDFAVEDVGAVRVAFVWPTGDDDQVELVEMLVTAGSGQDLHEIGCRPKEVVELVGPVLDLQPLPQMGFLGGDSHGAVVGVAGPHPEATDGLKSGVGDRNGIRSEGD